MNHWTENEELVRQYVLNTIDVQQRDDCEAHLEQCPRCREVIHRESMIAEGVRSYARRQMKERLKQRTVEQYRSTAPWPHILSAAAGVLIIVGLGYYNDWWMGRPSIPDEGPVTVQVEPPREEAVQPAPQGEETERDEPARRRTSASSREQSRTGAGVRTDVQPPVADLAEAPVEDRAISQAVSGASAKSTELFWIEGKIVPGSAEGMSTLMKQEAAEKSAASAITPSVDGKTQFISVSQAPLTRLPALQQRNRRQEGIPSSVNVANEVIHLTLYSDTLDLNRQGVRVQSVAEDSILVLIDGTQVGYRIPGGLRKERTLLKLLE